MSLAKFFWQRCPDQLGSALVANLMLKSMAREADAPGSRYLSEELLKHAGLVFVAVLLFNALRLTHSLSLSAGITKFNK